MSLFIGKYPLSLSGVLNNEGIQRSVFISLRLSRVLTALIGGFALGISGYVLQTIFKNPLAAPDIIGISSGASAGAAFGILFFASTFMTMFCSFTGAMIAVLLVLAIAKLDRTMKNETIILAGISIHALAQTVLMSLKLMADPEKQLSSIEYWIMGSLNNVSLNRILLNLGIIIGTAFIISLLHRQILLMANSEQEATMLGMDISFTRTLIVLLTTILVSATVSITGLISFVGLLAPHIARKLAHHHSIFTFYLSGMIGSLILIVADILARTVSTVELPVSIFTSLLGAPFLVYLLLQKRGTV